MGKVIRLSDKDIQFLESYRQYCIKKADNNFSIVALLESMSYSDLLHYMFISVDKRLNIQFF